MAADTLKLSCVQNIIHRSRKRLEYGYPVPRLGVPRSRPRWAAHTRIDNISESPPPPTGGNVIPHFQKENVVLPKESILR